MTLSSTALAVRLALLLGTIGYFTACDPGLPMPVAASTLATAQTAPIVSSALMLDSLRGYPARYVVSWDPRTRRQELGAQQLACAAPRWASLALDAPVLDTLRAGTSYVASLPTLDVRRIGVAVTPADSTEVPIALASDAEQRSFFRVLHATTSFPPRSASVTLARRDTLRVLRQQNGDLWDVWIAGEVFLMRVVSPGAVDTGRAPILRHAPEGVEWVRATTADGVVGWIRRADARAVCPHTAGVALIPFAHAPPTMSARPDSLP
jgi:hypothetical protein